MLRDLRARNVAAGIVVLTGHGTIDTAVKAIQMGAYDYLQKPCPIATVEMAIQKTHDHVRLLKRQRVLETGRFRRLGSSRETLVDVRVVAATNRDLAQATVRGHFREDLYYRLAAFTVTIPPLRARPELVQLFAVDPEIERVVVGGVSELMANRLTMFQALWLRELLHTFAPDQQRVPA